MKKYALSPMSLLLGTLTILPFIVLFSDAADQGIQFKIHMDKNIFLTGEDVLIMFELENASNATIDAIDPLLGIESALLVSVTDQKGKRYEYWPRLSEGRPQRVTLKPHLSETHFYVLNSWFGNRDSINREIGIFEPGHYKVDAKYYPNGPEKETMHDIAEFDVVSPFGKEVEALGLFLYAKRYPYADPEGCIRRLQQIVETHANSVYRPKAMMNLCARKNSGLDAKTRRSYLNSLISSYPNTLAAWEGILAYALVEGMGKSERIEYYNSLLEDIGQTTNARRIENHLQKLRDSH
jgi:hypothetical protein